MAANSVLLNTTYRTSEYSRQIAANSLPVTRRTQPASVHVVRATHQRESSEHHFIMTSQNHMTSPTVHITQQSPVKSPQVHGPNTDPLKSPTVHVTSQSPMKSPQVHMTQQSPMKSPKDHVTSSDPLKSPTVHATSPQVHGSSSDPLSPTGSSSGSSPHPRVIIIERETGEDNKTAAAAVKAGRPRAFEMTDTPHLSEAQVTEFREAFAMFDKDGDGSISVAELGHVMRSLGQNPTEHELTEMIREADDDNNGSVDFEEFLLLMSKKMSMLDIDQELLEAFSVFDKDGNGFIDQDELTNVLASLGEELDEEQVKEMMRQADKDGDGLVSFDEFKDIMCSKV